MLSLLILMSTAVAARADSTEGKPAGYTADCPYIFVHGFMGSTVYKDPSDPDSEAVWPPTGDAIGTAVKKSILPLLKVLITHNWSKFGDEVIPVVNEMFSPSFLGPDGNPVDNSGVRWEYPDAETITASSQLSYVYDWRIDPIEAAEGLNDFIDYVLEASGCSQVVLECHSYGGVVAITYATLYGTEKVRSWAFNSTAVFGETYNGELFTGQMRFDGDSLTEYLKGAFAYNEKENFFNSLFGFLNKIGLMKGACNLVNYLIKKIGMKKLSLGLIPMFGGWLSIWSMIPDEKIKESYDYVFDFCYSDDPTDRSGLKDKINDFNTRIRPYKAEELRKINEESNLYVISRYGFSGMFLTPSWKNETDTVIDLKYTSFGATAALHGEQLTAADLDGVQAEYISPGKNINASTCMFPEQTWFIRNFTHSYGGSDFDKMIKTLLYADGQANVKTFTDYPRFLCYNESNGNIEADK